jgi:hypothetical protein
MKAIPIPQTGSTVVTDESNVYVKTDAAGFRVSRNDCRVVRRLGNPEITNAAAARLRSVLAHK